MQYWRCSFNILNNTPWVNFRNGSTDIVLCLHKMVLWVLLTCVLLQMGKYQKLDYQLTSSSPQSSSSGHLMYIRYVYWGEYCSSYFNISLQISWIYDFVDRLDLSSERDFMNDICHSVEIISFRYFLKCLTRVLNRR